jgi:hypothetical protein
MKKILTSIYLTFCLLGAGCQTATVSYGGGDGSAPDKAVLIQGAGSSAEGVPAEYRWIAQHYPGAKRVRQALKSFGGKPQDEITIKTAAGEEKVLYFDISGFFGKGLGL